MKLILRFHIGGSCSPPFSCWERVLLLTLCCIPCEISTMHISGIMHYHGNDSSQGKNVLLKESKLIISTEVYQGCLSLKFEYCRGMMKEKIETQTGARMHIPSAHESKRKKPVGESPNLTFRLTL